MTEPTPIVLSLCHACVHPDNGWDHAEWVVSDKCRLHWGGYQLQPAVSHG